MAEFPTLQLVWIFRIESFLTFGTAAGPASHAMEPRFKGVAAQWANRAGYRVAEAAVGGSGKGGEGPGPEGPMGEGDWQAGSMPYFGGLVGRRGQRRFGRGAVPIEIVGEGEGLLVR